MKLRMEYLKKLIKEEFLNEDSDAPILVITQQYHYDKGTKTFSVEISSVRELSGRIHTGQRQLQNWRQKVILKNPKTGITKKFTFFKKDMDGSHEDTYGWWYKSDDGIKLLIIND